MHLLPIQSAVVHRLVLLTAPPGEKGFLSDRPTRACVPVTKEVRDDLGSEGCPSWVSRAARQVRLEEKQGNRVLGLSKYCPSDHWNRLSRKRQVWFH